MSEQYTSARMLSREAIRQFSETWDLHVGEEREMSAIVKSPVIDVVTFQSPLHQEVYPSQSPFASNGSWSWEPGVEGEPNRFEKWMTPDRVRFVADDEITDEVNVGRDLVHRDVLTILPQE